MNFRDSDRVLYTFERRAVYVHAFYYVTVNVCKLKWKSFTIALFLQRDNLSKQGRKPFYRSWFRHDFWGGSRTFLSLPFFVEFSSNCKLFDTVSPNRIEFTTILFSRFIPISTLTRVNKIKIERKIDDLRSLIITKWNVITNKFVIYIASYMLK